MVKDALIRSKLSIDMKRGQVYGVVVIQFLK
jgi:hypothetical protein